MRSLGLNFSFAIHELCDLRLSYFFSEAQFLHWRHCFFIHRKEHCFFIHRKERRNEGTFTNVSWATAWSSNTPQGVVWPEITTGAKSLRKSYPLINLPSLPPAPTTVGYSLLRFGRPWAKVPNHSLIWLHYIIDYVSVAHLDSERAPRDEIGSYPSPVSQDQAPNRHEPDPVWLE